MRALDSMHGSMSKWIVFECMFIIHSQHITELGKAAVHENTHGEAMPVHLQR